MKMVAAAKMRRAVESETAARPYQETLTRTLQRVAASATDVQHALLTPHAQVRNVCVVVVGTQRGLCGGFNSNLGRKVEDVVRRLGAEGKEVRLRSYGKKPR